MEDNHTSLMDKIKNGTTSEFEWELLAEARKLDDLPPYFLMRCPRHLRPGLLQDAPRDPPRSPTKGLSGLPAHILQNYAESDDNDGMKDGDVDKGELSDASVTASSSIGNEDEDHGTVLRLENSGHFRIIQRDLVAGVENRPSSFQLQEAVSTAKVDVISFAVRPRALATGTRRVGGTFVAPPQPLTTSDVDYDTEAEPDNEDEAVYIPAVVARTTAVVRNCFSSQSIIPVEEVEDIVPEVPLVYTKETTTAFNVESYVPTHLICTICQDDLSSFWDKNLNAPKEDLARHYNVCWKERPRTPPNALDANTAQYMGTKNLCTVSNPEARKTPSRGPNPIHCASCNKNLVNMDVVDAIVHKVNCFQAYCIQQEAWMCPICHQGIAGLEYEEEDKEYQRVRHVECCNGIRLRNEQMAEKHLQLYRMAQGVMQRIDWATNGYRERYGKRPESRGDRMRELKDRFFLDKNKFPVGRSNLRNETLASGEVSKRAFGRSSQIEVLENLGLFQRSQFAITHEELATQVVLAIDNDETQRKLKYNLFAEVEQKNAVIKQMQLEGKKKVFEANRKWLAGLREEQCIATAKKEEDGRLATTHKVDEDQLNFGDEDSELSFIDPAELKAVSDGDMSTSPKPDSGFDGEELPISGAITPETLPVTILAKPRSRQAEFFGNETAADWASEVQQAFDALTPSAVVVEVTPVKAVSTAPAHSFPDKQDIPKNLLSKQAEAKMQRLAAKKLERKEHDLKYTLFWGEELPVTWTESQDPADKPSQITLSLAKLSNDLVAQQVADLEVDEIAEVDKPETNARIDDTLESLPDHKKLALTLLHKRHISRVKAQRKLARVAKKTEKKALVCLSRIQRMLERAQAKTGELAHLASKEEELEKFELLPLRVRIHSIARIVADAEDEELGMAASGAVDVMMSIQPLEVSAELICCEQPPLQADSGIEMSSSSNEEDILMASENIELAKPRGMIAGVAVVDKHIVRPVWSSPLCIMAQNVQPTTVLDRMQARALDLFAGDVE